MSGVKLTLTDPVNHCPGTYVLHLYCKWQNPAHGFREFPWEPEDCETYGEAASQARKAGWVLHRDRTATCPKCAAIITPSGLQALGGSNATSE